MEEASIVPAKGRGLSRLDPELDDRLVRLGEAKRIITEAEARRKEAKSAADATYIEEVGSALADIEALNTELASFMERHHYALVRRLSRTIKRVAGTVYVVLRAKELDLPADLKAVAGFLFSDQEGEHYLKPYEPEVDKKALAAAFAKNEVPPRLLTKLHGLGVRYGKHLTFLVKSPTDASAVTISRRLYVERKRQK